MFIVKKRQEMYSHVLAAKEGTVVGMWD